MTYRREVALVYLGTAVFAGIAGVAGYSYVDVALVVLSLVSLILGYGESIGASSAVMGVLLYQPLAVAIERFVPELWSYLVSSIILIVLSERLSFEYQMASVLETPTGVDEYSRSFAEGLSRSHGRGLFYYALLAGGVSSLALLTSFPILYPSILAIASMLLMFILWIYTRR